MPSLQFRTGGETDNLLLISGAGDGDTGGGLCAFDGTSIEPIDRVSTAGVTVFDGHLARLLRAPLSTGGGEILIYDKRGVWRYLRVDELCDAHYMAWDGQCLIVTSTGTNSLMWIDIAGKIVREWRAPGEGDAWHLNDVCLVNGRLYACAFGKYPHYRDYKTRLDRGDGFVFDVESGRTVASGFCEPHSPRCFDGTWTVCESQRESVVQVDAETGCKKREVRLRSFTRGLAVSDDYLIVGESVRRYSDEGRRKGSIVILSRSDFGFVCRVDVPFREIAEIVVASRAIVSAAKTGFQTNPLRVRESDQLQMFRDIGMEPQRLWATSELLSASECRVRIDAEIPSSFICDRLTLVNCTITNLGDGFFCSELPHPVRLSYRWLSKLDSAVQDRSEPLRTDLPAMLPPGSSISLRMEILAPPASGEFELRLTLVQEGGSWFDQIDATNACSTTVSVTRADSNSVPRYWTARAGNGFEVPAD